jgi:hypothetical protein
LLIDTSTNLQQLAMAVAAAQPAGSLRDFRILQAGGIAQTVSAAVELLDPGAAFLSVT